MIFQLKIRNDAKNGVTYLSVPVLDLYAGAPTLIDAENDLKDLAMRQMGVDVELDFEAGAFTITDITEQTTSYILRCLRSASGITFKELAAEAGVKTAQGVQPYFVEFGKGKLQPRLPSIAAFTKLCRVMGHSIKLM